MHSDVGGGYPDESLSYVSLLWMMEEAEKAGLRTLQGHQGSFSRWPRAGPIHDSRKGVAAYYRYQPRRIAAWLHPPDPSTRILQDPDAKGHGLLTHVRLHHSVIERIVRGTDGYSPIVLPGEVQRRRRSSGGASFRRYARRLKNASGTTSGIGESATS